MPQAGYERETPPSERSQTHALNRTATGIGLLDVYVYGYGDNGHRNVWATGVSTYCTPSVTSYLSNAHARQRYGNAVSLR